MNTLQRIELAAKVVELIRVAETFPENCQRDEAVDALWEVWVCALAGNAEGGT